LTAAIHAAPAKSAFRYLALYARSKVRARLGDSVGARDDLLACQVGGDNSLETRVQLAKLLKPDMRDRATAEFERLIEECRATNTEDQWLALCSACVGTLWFDRATREAYRHFPDAAPLVAYRAISWSDADPEAQLPLAKRATELDAGCVRAWHCYAMLLGKSGHHEDAVEAYLQGLPLIDPSRAGVLWNNLSSEYLSLGQDEESLHAAEMAVDLDPYRLHHQVSLANALRRLNRIDEAMEAYEFAVNLKPNFAWTYPGYARVLALKGRDEEARTGLERVVARGDRWLRKEPRMAPARFFDAAAWVLATARADSLRDPTRAIELAQRAVDIEPGRADFRRTLGVARYRAGDDRGALEALAESMERGDGSDAYDWYFAAMAHWRLGHQDEARALCARANVWTDEHRPGDRQLRRFRAEAEELIRP